MKFEIVVEIFMVASIAFMASTLVWMFYQMRITTAHNEILELHQKIHKEMDKLFNIANHRLMHLEGKTNGPNQRSKPERRVDEIC